MERRVIERERTVEVLLATYNGERFLREQVDSILSQSYGSLRITARDDGSSDGTVGILEGYERRYPERFRVLRDGVRAGGAKWNFVRLMEQSTAPFVCLADQDDVWKRDKVRDSMAAMLGLRERHGDEVPLLVFSDLEVVDAELRSLYPSFWRLGRIAPGNIHRLERLLTQNVLTGCTAMLNRRLAQLAVRMTDEVFMHDGWIAVIASAMGAAAYLDEPTVLYRQHESNVVGAKKVARAKLIPRWRFHDLRREQWERSERQGAALLRVMRGELPERAVRLLEAYTACETSPYRLRRVWNLVRHGFFVNAVRPNLAMLWYLWDMKAAKRQMGKG